MKNRMLVLSVAFAVLALTGCNEQEGVTFVKNPDKSGETLTPPDWATTARSDIQSGLSMSLFSASCKLLYRDASWFVGCTPKDEQAPLMLYSVQQNKLERESFTVIAINKLAKRYAHQNLVLRQIITTDTQATALNTERLKQDFDALTGA